MQSVVFLAARTSSTRPAPWLLAQCSAKSRGRALLRCVTWSVRGADGARGNYSRRTQRGSAVRSVASLSMWAPAWHDDRLPTSERGCACRRCRMKQLRWWEKQEELSALHQLLPALAVRVLFAQQEWCRRGAEERCQAYKVGVERRWSEVGRRAACLMIRTMLKAAMALPALWNVKRRTGQPTKS
ncbi:putative retrotransposon hot spot protein 4 (RHS4) [Trypanosoma vivax]|nr:putative retrotransposon hot spot protein 4 (RHS4) [Trypanosoma vivax]